MRAVRFPCPGFSDEQAEVLQARAAAEGLSVEAWIQKLAEP
jgi:hypothetical protein